MNSAVEVCDATDRQEECRAPGAGAWRGCAQDGRPMTWARVGRPINRLYTRAHYLYGSAIYFVAESHSEHVYLLLFHV